MTDSPAAELRAAAALLRGAASKTTPGQWVKCWGTRLGSPAVALLEHVHPDGGSQVTLAHFDRRGDAAWIALLSPTMAEPLAAWLDGTAHYMRFEEAACSSPEAAARMFEEKYARPLEFARAVTKAATP